MFNLLAKTRILDYKPVETPAEMNYKLEELVNQFPSNKYHYQHLVGRLVYFSHTIPHIAYAVGFVGQFILVPSKEHMNNAYRILRYLKKYQGKGFLFSKYANLGVEGYTDSDWVGDQTIRRSTFKYFTFVGEI